MGIGFRLTFLELIWFIWFILSITLHKESAAASTPEENFGRIISADGKVRLINGKRYASGTVEVLFDSAWGTICNYSPHFNVSVVVCRQLGFKGGSLLYPNIRETGMSWFKKVQCFRNESSIFDCRHHYAQYDCRHGGDISIQCEYKYDIEFCNFHPHNCSFATTNMSAYKWLHSKGGYHYQYYYGLHTNHWTQNSHPGYFMYIVSSEGKPGDRAQLSNKTKINIDKGSITFYYYLYGDNLQILNVYFGEGEKGQLVWSESSDEDEKKWRFTCLPITKPIKDLVITFEAVRGSSDTGIVAINDIGISTKPCELKNVSCTFSRFPCGYEIIKSELSPLSWFLSYPFDHGPSNDHTTNSTAGGGFMAIYNEYSEGDRTSFQSPIIQTNQTDKIEFFFYLTGRYPGELQVAFTRIDHQNTNLKKTILWQEYEDHGIGWNYGCANLPANQRGKIVFTAIVGTTKKLNIAIDDVSVSKGVCKKNTLKMNCTFDVPWLCNYSISCSGGLGYIWKRHNGTTPTLNTGPDMDISKNKNGSYLYAESSYGNPGDSTTVTFPVVKNTTGKYLRFWYHMYGKDVGSLHLRFHSLKSSKEEWKMVGDQRNQWRSFCIQIINGGIDAFSLTAVRGSSFLGDIAIDNVRVDEQICPHPLDCDFSREICNYEFQTDYDNYNWIRTRDIYKYTDNGYFLEIKTQRHFQELATSSLVSPEINGKNANGSLRFYYQMYGTDINKFQIFLRNVNNHNRTELWNSNDNTITDWIMGCIDLPEVETIQIEFMSTNGFGSNGVIRLDNLTYHQEKCPVGILKQKCTFDNIKFCDYKINCDVSSYRWIRAKSTPTNDTGPNIDHTGSPGKGYFMYAESSQGRPRDRTELKFLPFTPPPRHYLHFYYNMNGRDSGELQVSIDTGSMRTLQWSDAGNASDNWIPGCINLTAGVNTTIIFTAIRGNGPLGDIAIDDVSVIPGFCPSRSLACEFTDDFLCGYKNMSHGPSWTRIYKESGFHMKSNVSRKISMRSPFANITNSCIRIYYRIYPSSYSSLDVFNNTEKKLMLYSGSKNDWMVGQFYIEKAQMFLQFEAVTDDTEILINRVEVTSGNCPSMDCPDDMVACKDQSYCIKKTWVCDTSVECVDGSDENRCPISIVCDFKNAHMCGYKTSEWMWHSTGFAILDYYSGNGSLISPKQQVGDVCVRFSYRARNQFSLYVLVHYENAKSNYSYTRWQLHFKNQELSWRVGQFFTRAGNIHLEFKAFVGENSFLQIDDVIFLKDHCPSLNCSSGDFLCGSEEKCVSEKDKCNRYYECEDKSDENNCPSSIDCDFENNYACGYKFQNWTLTTGRRNLVPRYDHSKKHSYGHYIATTFSRKGFVHLDSPAENMAKQKCFSFFYSFHGNSEFYIYDNNFVKFIIQPFNIDTWQKSQMQLDVGVHKLRFSVFLNSSNDKLALDSISTSLGSCPEFVCEEKWIPCQPDNICIPHYKFCDHQEDCPNGYDEQNCQSLRSPRLVNGENVHQGFIEYYHNGTWNRVCSMNNWSKKESTVVCHELGYRGIGRNHLKTKESPTIHSNIKSVRCFGHENSLSECGINFCWNCTCEHAPYVDCSHTNCSSSELPCPLKKTENYTRQIYKKDICLSKDLFCDGIKDCPGGTDEENCSQCNINEFQCLDKMCIPISQRCDGVKDCQDSSDEHHCFIHNGTSLFFLHDNKYQQVCENNLNNQIIANKLCKAVGKGNATIRQSVSSGKGIEFTRKQSSKNEFLPGLSPNDVPSCDLLNVSCNGEECGIQVKIFSEQLLENGISAFLGQWPWQVVFKKNHYAYCGGILIHQRYVLTNADCLIHNDNWTVSVGTINKTSGGVQYKTKRKIVQPKLSSFYIKNEIALLELTEPVQITDYIRPICLPSESWTPHMECYTTGWGMGESYNYPYYLKEVKVHLLSQDECISHFRGINQMTFCANNDKYTLGCLVDGGGPLVCQNKHGHWEIIGIAETNHIYCASNNFSPVTYIDVYSSLHWILQHLT